jgi:hypothetical protein
MRSPVVPIIGFLVGVVILAGYFVPSPALVAIRNPMLDWAVILSGVAGLIAIFHLVFGVHGRRLRDPEKSRLFSFIVILGFLLTAGAGLVFGVNNAEYKQVVTSIQMPIETSLMAVLAITLAYACLRLLQRQRNWMGFVFFIAVVLYLLVNSGIFALAANVPALRSLVASISQAPLAGARGILIGVALGTLLTGIRILIGSDRPYNS